MQSNRESQVSTPDGNEKKAKRIKRIRLDYLLIVWKLLKRIVTYNLDAKQIAIKQMFRPTLIYLSEQFTFNFFPTLITSSVRCSMFALRCVWFLSLFCLFCICKVIVECIHLRYWFLFLFRGGKHSAHCVTQNTKYRLKWFSFSLCFEKSFPFFAPRYLS